MTTDTRNKYLFVMLFVLGSILMVSQVYAADVDQSEWASDRYAFSSAEIQFETKDSSADLLQMAQAEADKELADLKAELSRVTHKRLATVTYDLEFSVDDVDPTPSETRVAATLIGE